MPAADHRLVLLVRRTRHATEHARTSNMLARGCVGLARLGRHRVWVAKRYPARRSILQVHGAVSCAAWFPIPHPYPARHGTTHYNTVSHTARYLPIARLSPIGRSCVDDALEMCGSDGEAILRDRPGAAPKRYSCTERLAVTKTEPSSASALRNPSNNPLPYRRAAVALRFGVLYCRTGRPRCHVARWVLAWPRPSRSAPPASVHRRRELAAAAAGCLASTARGLPSGAAHAHARTWTHRGH
jgi:hypothetical protein